MMNIMFFPLVSGKLRLGSKRFESAAEAVNALEFLFKDPSLNVFFRMLEARVFMFTDESFAIVVITRVFIYVAMNRCQVSS